METTADRIERFNNIVAETLGDGLLDLGAIWGRLRNAQFISQEDPEHIGKAETHDDLVDHRLGACLFSAGVKHFKALHAAGTRNIGYGEISTLHTNSIKAAKYFGTDVDIAQESDIVPVFVEHLDSTDAVRNAAFDALKLTWSQGSITQTYWPVYGWDRDRPLAHPFDRAGRQLQRTHRGRRHD